MRRRTMYSKSKKIYKYLYRKLLDKELIKRAFFKMRKGKTNRKSIIRITNNLDHYVDLMYDILLNSIPDYGDSEKAFHAPIHEPFHIIEHGKERTIYVPSTMEQWMHHIIMQVLAPILQKRFHYDSYGSIPKKGLHKGKKAFLRYRRKSKYALKIDVRHFFGSIRREILIDKLREFICDDWFINLIEICFEHHEKGLPLGYYLSQWLSNVYLDEVDYFIESQSLKHIRYVDDVVIFGSNKRKLWGCLDGIEQLLGKDRLVIKDSYSIYHVKKEPVSFLGFVFTENQVRLRKNIAHNILKVVNRIDKAQRNHRPIWIKDVRTILSYLGWIKHSDSYKLYLSRIKPYVNISKMKKIVSSYGKEKQDDKLGNREIRPQTVTA